MADPTLTPEKIRAARAMFDAREVGLDALPKQSFLFWCGGCDQIPTGMTEACASAGPFCVIRRLREMEKV
jgi:hypothetical protein